MRSAVRHPARTLAVWALLLAIATPWVLRLRIETATESFLDRSGAEWEAYQKSQDRFGGDETVTILLEGPRSFDRAALEDVLHVSRHFHQTEGVRRVDSLATLPVVAANPQGELSLEPALTEIPVGKAEKAALRDRVERDRIAPRTTISADERAYAVNLVVEKGAEHRYPEILSEIDNALVGRDYAVSGVPVFRVFIEQRIQGKGEDSVVKVRPVDPDRLDAEWRVSPNMKVEVDAMPGGYVCSASVKGKPADGDTRSVALAGLPIRKLFSKEQRTFFAVHAPDGIELDHLVVLGPIFVLKVSFTPLEFERKMVAELWFYPDGRRLLELSTKCAPGETMQVATETRLFLADHDIDLTGVQETKTKNALQFFAKEVREAAMPPAGNGAGAGASEEPKPSATDEAPVGVTAAALDGDAGASEAGADANPE